jgi:hypothetical protein
MTDVLADPHRRAIANLSIPRSVFDLTHTLAVDEHSQTLSVDETHRLLEQLVAQGLVVNLGEHDDPARLAHQVERSEALTMPDEKAATYARRVAMPRQQWRLRGDTYMLTEPGLERLREPVAEARRFTTEELHSSRQSTSSTTRVLTGRSSTSRAASCMTAISRSRRPAATG